MKFLKNTYSTLFASMALAVAAVGCSDELDYPTIIKEGYPATIKVNVSLPEMTPITRADMQAGKDTEVNSLWIGVYSTSSLKRTGRKEITGAGQMGEHNASSQVEIDAKTGYSYIVAVANYKGRNCLDSNGEKKSYEKALEEADTFEKFQGISAMFNDDGDINVSTPLNALLMSGHYIEGDCDGSYTEATKAAIDTDKTLTGSIHLRRLMSQVKFNVTYNTDNISDFQVISYQVKKVPNQSWLYESTDGPSNVGDSRKVVESVESYQSSQVFTQLNETDITVKNEDGKEETKRGYTFDWWQYENKRTGKDWVSQYSERELEYKNSDGTNSEKYKSLLADSKESETIPSVVSNNNATFLELKVRMTMKKDYAGESDLPTNYQRTVDATYTIHLGYCEGEGAAKARDFNCRRNAKYTYIVNVNNVNDIKVEAESDVEKTPGAEGIITDVAKKFVELDAHYGVYNIYLPSAKKGEFRYIIRCYDQNSTLITIDSKNDNSIVDKRYKNWVEIKKADSETMLAEYDPNDENQYNLEEFKNLDTIEEGWYTVFFNEYVYDDQKWTAYVNKPERTVWLSVDEKISTDKESAIYSSQYTFSQKSIQTYYGSGDKALGVERVNESFGLNFRNSFNNKDAGTVVNNGRWNTWQYLKNKTWGQVLSQNEYQDVNPITNTTISTLPADVKSSIGGIVALPKLARFTGTIVANDYDPDKNGDSTDDRNYIEAINACTNRNRDLNGNSTIEEDELRWYVPSANQYVEMVLGTPSLDKPIMDYAKYPKIEYKIGEENANLNLMYYTSDGQVLWAMEGFSTSNWTNDGKEALYTKGFPWEVRCVRNLKNPNIASASISQDSEVDPPYKRKSSEKTSSDYKIIQMTNYDSKSIRVEIVDIMNAHVISNQSLNSTYKAFEYKDEYLKLSELAAYGYDTYGNPSLPWNSKDKGNWQKWLDSGENPCGQFNDEENGVTGWRVPNQKELMVLLTLGTTPTPSDKIYDISATFAHYKGESAFSGTVTDLANHQIMMVIDPKATEKPAIGTQNDYNTSYQLRCVRDWYEGIDSLNE